LVWNSGRIWQSTDNSDEIYSAVSFSNRASISVNPLEITATVFGLLDTNEASISARRASFSLRVFGSGLATTASDRNPKPNRLRARDCFGGLLPREEDAGMTAGVHKKHSLPDGSAKGTNRPVAEIIAERRAKRSECAKDRTSPDGLATGSTRWRPINVGLGGGGSLG
jgi:hypothetical protein